MRIYLLLILILLANGCRTSPSAEREIANLRQELIDLQNLYYGLPASCRAEGNFDSLAPIEDGQCIGCDADPTRSTETFSDPDSGAWEGFDQIESVIEDPPGNDLGQRQWQNSRQRSPSTWRNIGSVDINRRISRGENLDGIPGDEGLTLLIQPRDTAGNVIKHAGRIMVSINELVSGQQKMEIGTWQFTAEETANFLVRDDLVQQGFLLHLPWTTPPVSDAIDVVVEFSIGNQSSSAAASIQIIPPEQGYSISSPLIADWVERDPRWKTSPSNSEDDIEISLNDLEEKKPSRRVRPLQRISAPAWRPIR